MSSSCQIPERKRVGKRFENGSEATEEARLCFGTVICTYCDVCRLICPELCITRDPLTGEIIIDLDYCKGCGLCAYYCPKGAITMVVEK